MCAKRPVRDIVRWPDAEERAGDGERVRDPRTVRYEELNAIQAEGERERFGERERVEPGKDGEGLNIRV